MGVPFEIVYKEDHVEFRLPNKPELLCLIDKVDFRDHVQNTKCWYIHKSKTSGFYVRRTLWPSGLTDHLHRYVVKAGDFCPVNSVVDHLDRDGLNNRSGNVILTTQKVNMNNRANSAKISHKGHAITYIEKKRFYQSYDKRLYIGGGNTVDKVKEKIDKYISNLNSGEENERI